MKKIIDDTDRRLNILFDGLNNETVPPTAVGQMNNIAKGELLTTDPANFMIAIAAKDANAALAMHVELLTTASGDMTTWAVSHCNLFVTSGLTDVCYLAWCEAAYPIRVMMNSNVR